MIEMHLSFIPARGTHDPWEVASATVGGVAYSERSRSSCIAKLARTLVAAGVPDQPWQALRGRSLHGIAKTTIMEGKRGLQRVAWQPYPKIATLDVCGLPENGSEAADPEDDTKEDQKAAQRENASAQGT